MERRTCGKQCSGNVRTVRQHRAHGRANNNELLNPLEKQMKPVQEYTAVLSARLIDTRTRKDIERARDAMLRERRETKDTLRYNVYADLRASALVD